MPIIIEASYSKKLGLPNFSSHSFVVSVRAEVQDLSQVDAECNRLHAILQRGVDRRMKRVGFLPDALTYGMVKGGPSRPRTKLKDGPATKWACTAAQRILIVNLVAEHALEKQAVENLALTKFAVGVRKLNRRQADAFIAELMQRYPQPVEPTPEP